LLYWHRYWTDDGNLAGLRYEQWKAVFMEQKAHVLDVWAEPLVQLRMPRLFDLRSDPFERAQHEPANTCVGSSSTPS
jgi:arylsulfatase